MLKGSRDFGLKVFWLVTGLLALAAGMAGAALPMLPTTPFLLLAAFCFARSSNRMSRWLANHQVFGPVIENWRHNGSIDRKSKWMAMVVIVPSPLITWWLEAPAWVLVCQVLLLTTVAIFILTRPSPGGQRA